MSDASAARYVMNRLTSSEWVINDEHYPTNDFRHVVACVYEVADTEVEVTWLRDLPLATRYGSAFEVLEQVERTHRSSAVLREHALPAMNTLPTMLAT